MNKDYFLIKSVIGFKLKNVKTMITEEDGSVREYTGGIMSTNTPEFIEPIQPKFCDKKWFTNFNQELLDKIIDYQKINS
jgi:hypothetical protein